MKRFILLAMLGLASIIATPAKAQVSVSINIGSQPQWGPRGYNYVDYYYLPDVESYYYVPTRKFIYLSGNRWVHHSYLPSRYRGYNLHSGRKYVINSPRPYMHHHIYQGRYGRSDWGGHKHYSKRYYQGRDRYRNDDRGRRYERRDHDRRDHNRGRYERRGERRDIGFFRQGRG
jgi:hypothetical protein